MANDKGNILLIDDNARFLKQIKRILVDAGFTVETAMTIEQAKIALAAQDYDLVTIDLELQEDNLIREGDELLIYIRHHYPGVRRIVMSAEVEDHEEAVSLVTELGANDFIDKSKLSSNIKRFLEKIERSVEASRAIHPPARSTHFAFISYRRSASQAFALRLYDHLSPKISGELFIDQKGLGAGSFPDALRASIERCDVFLPIIAPGTFDRIHEPEDWVRTEIELALGSRCVIIPVFDGDPTGFTQDDLPDSLHGLLSFNGVPFYSHVFEACVENLASKINEFRKVQPSA